MVKTGTPAIVAVSLEAVAGVGAYEWHADADGLSWSPGLLRIYGLDAAPNCEGGFTSLVHADDRVRVEAETSAYLGSDAGTYAHQFRIVRPDGAIRFILDRGEIERDAEGRVTVMRGVNVDITDVTNSDGQTFAISNGRDKPPEDPRPQELKLRETEARFRAALEASQGILWTNDAAGKMVGEQPAWMALTGQTLAEYQGYGWARAVHPDDAQPSIDAWNAAVADARPFEFEHRIRRRDGVWRRFSARAVPIFDEAGVLQGWVGVHHDITDSRATEFRFRQLAETIDEVFYIFEIEEGRISYVSPAYERVWRRSARDLLADAGAYRSAIHPEDRYLADAAIALQIAGQNSDIRYRLCFEDGDITFIHDRAFVTTDPETGARRVVGLAEDVTTSTQARQQLARNAETFEALVRNNPFGVYVVDGQFRLLHTSQGTQRVFDGVDPLLGRDFAEILHILWAEPFASEAIAHFRHTLATGEPYTSKAINERRLNRDVEESYDWRIERIILPSGEHGVVCYFYDLSERVALEAQLKQALDDKDMLTREIDHRVRNSLSIMSALLSMQANRSPSPAVKQALSVAVTRLQAVARVHERLYKSTTIGVLEFASYVEEICSDLRALLDNGFVQIKVTTVPIDLDVDKAVPLGLIINELVTNAFKHCGPHCSTVHVELELPGAELLMTVSDDGAGMPRSFEPHSRQGLGMQVVRLLVTQLHGKLKIPAAGEPARFVVSLPLGN